MKKFFIKIPLWAVALVFIALVVNSLFLYHKHEIPFDSSTFLYKNDSVVYDRIIPGSPDELAGIRKGDVLLAINSFPVKPCSSGVYGSFHGTDFNLTILRGTQLLSIKVTVDSIFSQASVFYWILFVAQLLFNVTGLYILYRKPDDKAVRLFFIYMQLISITSNALSMPLPYWSAIFAGCVFMISGLLQGPVLIQFHLLFPSPLKKYRITGWILKLFYALSILYLIPYVVTFILWANDVYKYDFRYGIMDRIALGWVSLSFITAVTIAVTRFYSVSNTLHRNQLRLVILGSFFYFATLAVYALFYDYINQLNDYSTLIMIPNGIGTMIMITFILVAIFRYRIWETEFYIRRVLFYLSATLIIILFYMALIYLVDLLTMQETRTLRFAVIALSVLTFLLLRDWLQRIIERIFHREMYDSASVVSGFEEKLAGVYLFDDLVSGIAKGLDGIFHFKMFGIFVRGEGQVYQPVFSIGLNDQLSLVPIETSFSFERMLKKNGVFSPDELEMKQLTDGLRQGEVIVPLLKEGNPFGFFLCGEKKSEKTYSLQDIRVLQLIAKRAIALFHTSALYQRELERQLMLERERARISKDMHDDIGAGLTKIAMISEAGSRSAGDGPAETERLSKVATSAREMINRLNVIVWALNPKYDNLESLISYTRRYFGEYLENLGIDFVMDTPDIVPELPVSPDFRRNLFYAWQEAIHNSVKHSGCSEINFTLKFEYNRMLISISDKGKGFEHARPGSGGNGLLNMKKRTEDSGGSFRIESIPGKGTRVDFNFPLKSME